MKLTLKKKLKRFIKRNKYASYMLHKEHMFYLIRKKDKLVDVKAISNVNGEWTKVFISRGVTLEVAAKDIKRVIQGLATVDINAKVCYEKVLDK